MQAWTQKKKETDGTCVICFLSPASMSACHTFFYDEGKSSAKCSFSTTNLVKPSLIPWPVFTQSRVHRHKGEPKQAYFKLGSQRSCNLHHGEGEITEATLNDDQKCNTELMMMKIVFRKFYRTERTIALLMMALLKVSFHLPK